MTSNGWGLLLNLPPEKKNCPVHLHAWQLDEIYMVVCGQVVMFDRDNPVTGKGMGRSFLGSALKKTCNSLIIWLAFLGGKKILMDPSNL